MGVSVTPGHTALTLMPSLSWSVLREDRKIPWMACFDVWYKYKPGLSRKALTLDSKVKDLLLCSDLASRRKTAAMREKCNVPMRFTSSTLVLPGSSLMLSMLWVGSNQLPCSNVPAQEIAWSTWPCLSCAFFEELVKVIVFRHITLDKGDGRAQFASGLGVDVAEDHKCAMLH